MVLATYPQQVIKVQLLRQPTTKGAPHSETADILAARWNNFFFFFETGVPGENYRLSKVGVAPKKNLYVNVQKLASYTHLI